MANQNHESRYRTIFNRCDGNNDGYISVGELENFVNSNSAEAKTIPSHVVNKIHRMAHVDQNQKMDYKEFVNLMKRWKLQHIFEITANYLSKYINCTVPRKPTCQETGVRLVHIYSCCPPPFFMLLVSIIEIALYLADGNQTVSESLLYDPTKRHEVWRYWTYMFIHKGFVNLFANMFWRLLLGMPLENGYGWWRVMIIYFAGGITGSLAHTLVSPVTNIVEAGSGINSLMTAHIASVIMNWNDVLCPFYQIIFFSACAVFIITTELYDAYVNCTATLMPIEAETAGAVAGLLLGLYMLRPHQATRTKRYVRWTALIVYILLMGSVIILNIAKPGLIEKPS